MTVWARHACAQHTITDDRASAAGHVGPCPSTVRGCSLSARLNNATDHLEREPKRCLF